MDVSMDGLRIRLISSYNSLVKKLNNAVVDKSFDAEIIIDPSEISRELDGIRNCLVTLAFSYIEGVDGFKELDEDKTHFEEFMPEVE
jgi:hypothetical protein